MEMISNMNGTHYDELIGGTAVPVLTKNVTLKGVTASYKRGTLLALVGGKYEIVDNTASESGADKASVILANDIVLSGADVVTTVYISDRVNLIVKNLLWHKHLIMPPLMKKNCVRSISI